MSIFRGRQGSAPPEEARPERLDLIVFSRQMAIFLRAGIPILDGIRVVRQQAISGVFRRTLDDVTIRLQEGMPLWAALSRHPNVFFDLYVEMVRAAEPAGELDAMLDQLARYLETSQATDASRRRGGPRIPSIATARPTSAPYVPVAEPARATPADTTATESTPTVDPSATNGRP